ncbi:MAG: rod shape-determining protein MreD [Helcococcus sp.]|nr:rod shape-determining protein MreD [Helcococcus sp.]
MKKRYLIIILFILNLIIDLSILSRYEFYGYTPSFTIPIIIVLSMFANKESIVYYAILQGIFQDLAFGQIIGLNALMYYLISYYTFKNVKDNQYNLSYGNIVVILSVLFKNVFRIVSSYLISRRPYFSSIYDFVFTLITELIFTLIIFDILHFIYSSMDKKRIKNLF